MAPRAQWKGFLKLSLVSCPIALYPAITPAERVTFRHVNRETGNRLKQQLVDTVTGEVVERDQKTRGYELGSNEFLMVEERDLAQAHHQARELPFRPAPRAATPPLEDEDEEEAPVVRVSRRLPARDDVRARKESAPEPPPPPPPVRVENDHTIYIDRFLVPGEVDSGYYLQPYFIVPREPVGQETFAVIREALRNKGMAGLGHVVLSSRERPILIQALDNGLRGTTLRYAHEVRSSEEYFANIPEMTLPSEMIELAEHILEQKAAPFDPALLEDRYRTALVSMLRQKQQTDMPRAVSQTPSRENVINLMDALRRSIAVERPAARAAKPSSRRAAATLKTLPARRSKSRARG